MSGEVEMKRSEQRHLVSVDLQSYLDQFEYLTQFLLLALALFSPEQPPLRERLLPTRCEKSHSRSNQCCRPRFFSCLGRLEGEMDETVKDSVLQSRAC